MSDNQERLSKLKSDIVFSGIVTLPMLVSLSEVSDAAVHYCGLGPWGQKPLRNGEAKRGIVRPNKACPLHEKLKP